MRIVWFLPIVIIAIAVALLSERQLDLPAFVSGEVAVFQATTNRHAVRQLNSKQLAKLQVWLNERKSGWSPLGKVPPETVIELIDVDGHKFHIRIANNIVMATETSNHFLRRKLLALGVFWARAKLANTSYMESIGPGSHLPENRPPRPL